MKGRKKTKQKNKLVFWRNWIAHLTTDQEVPGSSPG